MSHLHVNPPNPNSKKPGLHRDKQRDPTGTEGESHTARPIFSAQSVTEISLGFLRCGQDGSAWAFRGRDMLPLT